jgi:hypothetical protein
MSLKTALNVRTWGWKQYLVAAAIAFGIYVTLGIVFAGGGTIPTPPANVPIQMYGATIANNRINTKAWSFDYDHAQLSPDASTGTVEGIRHGIVFKKGKPDLRSRPKKLRSTRSRWISPRSARYTSKRSTTSSIARSIPTS